MPDHPEILIIEDTGSLLILYSEWLRNAGLDVDTAESGTEALEKLRSGFYRVALLDLQLPDLTGFDVLRVIGEEAIPTAVVVVTSDASINTAVEAMRAGAYDFVVKPVSESRLVTTTANAVERQALQKVVDDVRGSVDEIRRHGFVGSSPVMLGVYKTIESVASSTVPVFITGESGTGKEICAEAIHRAGPRSKKPFIALNCAAIPKDLIESEIFGHVQGAFTGATKSRVGAAKSADGGTLFLDEICELDLSLQAKLLRFLQTGTVQPVGSDKATAVNLRIVCATNREPRLEVAEGRFREDLFYRLHVVPLRLPALRARGADILELAASFLAEYASDDGKSFKAFSPEAETRLMAHDWPGNVRELQNVIRGAVVLNDAKVLTADMLGLADEGLGGAAPGPTEGVRIMPEPQGNAELPLSGDASITLALDRSFAENERKLIEAVIDRCDGSVPKAARILNVSPSTIYRKREAWAD
ncbi:sigma-54-dependent transcriptional regulator [Pelagibius sp.]|uniref:sigma-54-dependent transcriptional regulator n=1 Tax=Pelagibius sp. TaxID=1931238 RepID=UPI003BB06B5C